MIARLAAAFALLPMPGGAETPAAPAAVSGALPAPPVAARKPYKFQHHGITIEDPYAWLRDKGYPKVDDKPVLDYLIAENAYFEAAMAPSQALVETLAAEMKARIKQDDASVPAKNGAYLYQWRFETGAQYRRWHRTPVAGGPEQLILDEPALAAGKQFFKLGAFQASPDGRTLAYSSDESGAERFTLRFKDLESGTVLPESITGTLGEVAWSADGRSILYTLVNKEWRPYQVRMHVLGTAVGKDKILFEEKDPRFRVDLSKTQSRKLIVITSGDHTIDEVRFVAAADPSAKQTVMVPRSLGKKANLDEANGTLYLRINDTHRNFRLVTAPLAQPEPGNWKELIAGSDQRYLRSVHSFESVLTIEDRVDGLDRIVLRNYADGAERSVPFPDPAYQAKLAANPEFEQKQIRLEYQSMVTPLTVFDYDLASGQLQSRKVQEIPSGYDAGRYVTERVFATGRDGARIPVTLVYGKDWKKGTGQPLHLYAYGAYGIASQPSFSTNRLSLLDRGFAYAIAHIRGGDEMGYGWYEDGKLEKRTNTFHDFVDAAKFLVAQGWAAPKGISISGGSAGGELMGAVLNDAPELWRAAAAHVPFVDVLNTMLDATLPLTPPEWNEWGNPIKDAKAFAYIRSYSPYDNVKAQAYPPILITAGLNDPRVTYWEPAKWAARLRATKTDKNLLLLKTNMGAGHGGKSGRFDRLREVAEEYAFILRAFENK